MCIFVIHASMPNQIMPCILEWRECNTRLHCLSAYGRGPIESEVIYFHRKASVQEPMNQCVFALLSSRCVFKLPGYHLGWIITYLVYIDLLMCCVTHGTHKRTGQCYRKLMGDHTSNSKLIIRAILERKKRRRSSWPATNPLDSYPKFNLVSE